MNLDSLAWDEHGLIPAVVQDAATQQVLMVAYMNAESLRQTLDGGETIFWSRNRGELWHKGATSGNTQTVREIRVDCDGDTLLILVDPAGQPATPGQCPASIARWRKLLMPDMLTALQTIIQDRQQHPQPGSYTNHLLDEGLSRIAQKVGEEAVEVVVAALSQERERQIEELSDLFYHTLVLMAAKSITLDDVYAELERRHSVRKESAGG